MVWISILVALVIGLALAQMIVRGRRDANDVAHALDRWRAPRCDSAGVESMIGAFSEGGALESRVLETDATAPDLFLAGCRRLARGQAAGAARAFGAAYHVDYRLACAALLTFVCLKCGGGEASIETLKRLALETWNEMGRPGLLRGGIERRLATGLGLDRVAIRSADDLVEAILTATARQP